jgi:hypothetical protein
MILLYLALFLFFGVPFLCTLIICLFWSLPKVKIVMDVDDLDAAVRMWLKEQGMTYAQNVKPEYLDDDGDDLVIDRIEVDLVLKQVAK